MPLRTGGIQCRVSSPPGPSTLMTSAPRSPSIWVQYGPASTREKSATSSPVSGPGLAGVWFIRGKVIGAGYRLRWAGRVLTGERKARRRLLVAVEVNGETRVTRDRLHKRQASWTGDSKPGRQRVGQTKVRSGDAGGRSAGCGRAR